MDIPSSRIVPHEEYLDRYGEEKAYAIACTVSYLVDEAIIDLVDAETTQVGILCGVELFVVLILCKLHLQTNAEIMQHLHKAMFSPMWYRHLYLREHGLPESTFLSCEDVQEVVMLWKKSSRTIRVLDV